MTDFTEGARYLHKALGGEYIFARLNEDGTGVFTHQSHPAEEHVFELERMTACSDSLKE
jgi:hypothetical protein|tara:strand:- start:971 stop:1147 length:177 start_codon:yes stop_codon:yes gene_type:complete